MYKHKSNIYCLNCGKAGHLQSRCLYPINSWGIVCISYKDCLYDKINHKINHNNLGGALANMNCLFEYDTKTSAKTDTLLNDLKHNLKFILIKRKNSLCYVEFIRGRYYFDNLQYIYNMISKMSIYEQNSLCTEEFNILWCEMWNIEAINKNHIAEYTSSKTKFNKLRNGIICYFSKKIPVFISLKEIVSRNKSKYKEPEWEIPKGRKNSKEVELDCSMREFFEETNISNDRYTLLFEDNCFIEKYVGSDGVTYKNNYFLAELNDTNPNIKLDNTICQLNEVSGIKLVSYNDAMELIRDYSLDKKDVLTNILNIVWNIISS